LEIDFDVANGVRRGFDVINGGAKKLDALESSGGDANN
jgi:hypothetical protein